LVLLISLQINAQKITESPVECGTAPPSPEEVVKLPYYNNGQYLIDKAIEKRLPKLPNISSLKQGMYYLRVNSSNSVITKKLLKIILIYYR